MKQTPYGTSSLRKWTLQAVEELVARVEAGHSETLKNYLATMAKFYRYSLYNVLRIHQQFPQARHVAGYRTWQKLGRQVQRGQRSIRILVPVFKRTAREAKDDNEEKDSDEKILTAFRTAGVFDVSQTEGRPLPEFSQVTGDPGEFLDRLKAFIAGQGIRLKYARTLGGAEGMSLKGGIVLRQGLGPAAEFSVLVHELCHEILHQEDNQDLPRSKTVWETEAEAVAFVVCQAIGQANHDAIRMNFQMRG